MDEIEEIKRRIDIVDLISNYLTLKKAGANYKAICPFHQEKTPSMMVSAEKQIFKCFGCGEGGDIFSFVMKMENLEFREALEMLAERAGVKLSRRNIQADQIQTDRKTRLYEINDLAAKVFHKLLTSHPSGRSALAYLKDRKLTGQTIKDFQIGYAPSSRVLKKFLISKGFKDQEIVEAGSPDRFFKRIMFPIRDTMGHCIGFTGRVTESNQEPKYLNTADTIIFHKGRLLYNLDQAKAAIKQERAAIIVEGQMDVIASHQAGVQNVVASSGTALTEEHLRILYRYSPNIIFSFDSDSAGLSTAKKAYEMALVEKMNVKMVELGEFKDPGEMIATGPPAGGLAAWQKTVKNAVPVVEWYFNLAFNKKDGRELSAQEKKEIAKELLPIIKIIPDSVEQAHYVTELSKRLAVKEEIIFTALNKAENSPREASKTAVSTAKENLPPLVLLLGLLLKKLSRLEKIGDVLTEQDFTQPREKTIYKELVKAYNNDSTLTLKALLGRLDRGVKNDISELVLKTDAFYEKESSDASSDRPEKEEDDFKELIVHLKENHRETLKEYYAREIQKAESARDIAKLKNLIQEFQEKITKK